MVYHDESISHQMLVCMFQVKVEGLRDSLYCVSCEAVAAQLEALVEKTEDFTDSAYTSHEQRETIIQLCQITRQETKQLINTWRHAVRGTHTHIRDCTDQSFTIWLESHLMVTAGGKLQTASQCSCTTLICVLNLLSYSYLNTNVSLGLYICPSHLCCAVCEGCSSCLSSCGVTAHEPHTLIVPHTL